MQRAGRLILIALTAPLLLASPAMTQTPAPAEAATGTLCASTRAVLASAGARGWTAQTAPKTFTWEEGTKTCEMTNRGGTVTCDLLTISVCEGSEPPQEVKDAYSTTNRDLGRQGPGLILACLPNRMAEGFATPGSAVSMQGVEFTAQGEPKIRLFQRIEHSTVRGKKCVDQKVQIDFSR